MAIFYALVKKKTLLFVWMLCLITSLLLSPINGQTAQLSSNDSILMVLNVQRILGQVNLVQASLTKGDNTQAFEHAYISHSIILPSIKDKLKEIDQDSTERLESLLIDLPILVKSSSSQSTEIGSKLIEITSILNKINSKLLDPTSTNYHPVMASTIIVLLNDTAKFYELSNFGDAKDPSNQVDYENAVGTLKISQSLYKNISKSFSDSKQQEFESFFTD